MSDQARFMGPMERALYLKTLGSFAPLGARELAMLAQHARERLFRRGSLLLRAGERVERFHALVDGEVRAIDAGPVPGEPPDERMLGLVDWLAGSASAHDVVAVSDVLTLEFDTEVILDVFEDHFVLVLRQIRYLARLALEERRALASGTLLQPWTSPVSCPQRELDLVERLVLVRRSPPFHKSSLDALAEIARAMRELRPSAGELLWSQGEEATHLLVIVSGSVSCEHERGRFQCGPGYPLGNLEALALEPRWYSARAETDLVVLRVDTEHFLDILEDHFEMAMDFLAAMGSNLLQMRAERGERAGAQLEEQGAIESTR